jgi:glycosyltransferase involved in cell wall biosynthesis
MATLERCVANVINIASDSLLLEIIIVDDCSTDESLSIANNLATQYDGSGVLRHAQNIIPRGTWSATRDAKTRSGLRELK